MLKLILFFIFCYISALILPLVFTFKKDKDIEKEVQRWSNLCKADNNWTSKGRLYSVGLTAVKHKKTGKKKFVKQKKLVDIGLIEKKEI